MRIDSNNVNGNYGYHITRANQPHKKDENQSNKYFFHHIIILS